MMYSSYAILAAMLPILCTEAFSPTIHSSSSGVHRNRDVTRLFAGPPQYEKLTGVLREAKVVGKGSVLLQIDTQDENKDEDNGYEPGHVLALEIQGDMTEDDGDEKTMKDMAANDGWLRGPYTVTRATDKSMDILMKITGDKSTTFANAQPGTILKYGGKFHTPIVQGIQTADADNLLKRVVMISTGVGVGPCIGAIEKALLNPSFPPIKLITSYRTHEEVLFNDYLNQIQTDNPDQFAWENVVTTEMGRLSATKENLALVTDVTTNRHSLNDTHYHLIGNGQMVNEFKAALEQAGVPDERVTIESYFNHREETDSTVIDRIAEAVKDSCAANVTVE